jgi:hypothetical protein
MAKHAILAPSSAHRWLKCGYSIKGDKVTKIDLRYANEGTRAHKLAELYLTGKPINYNELCVNAFNELDYSMIGHVKKYTNYVESLGGNKVEVETKVVVNDKIWGTLDYIAYHDNYTCIVDLKYGKTPVNAQGNPQLMIYAVGVWWLSPDKPVEIHIVQPRADIVSSRVMLSIRELSNFYDTLQHRSETIDQDNKKTPGIHCKYCQVKCEYRR